MYEEITKLEHELVKVLDKYKDIPLALRVGVLENVKLIIQLHTEPIRDILIPTETVLVGDEGAAMTIVEKNLDTG